VAEARDPGAERTDTNPKDTAKFWQSQLELADKDQGDWEKDGKSVVDRYRAESKRAKKGDARWFNILFSNTETLKSTLYGRTAKPDVRRRFADKDPAAREAAEVIERALIYCAEQYDVDKCIEPALHDYLLPGRGVVRVEYEPIIKERPVIDQMTAMPTMGDDGKPQMEEFVADQIVREQYVYWKDYRQSPARVFAKNWWIAFRHIMSREDLRDNEFKNADKIPLNWEPDREDNKDVPDDLKKAEVWEIWDKSRRKRIWIVKGYIDPLKVEDDPYGLEGFFPMPEPIVSIQDTETMVPRPEYFEYRDQAEDLDEIVGRISKLTKALRRRGVYDQSVKELKRLATAGDNQFIPVENWGALSTKGGLQAAFQSEDISLIAVVLKELYLQRDMLVQGIYELTGIADIMRGSSDPNETLGAQQLKAQFGSTRIKRRQRAVQKWIRDLYKIKAELMAEHFEPQVLSQMTGVQVTPEIVEILRSDKLRGYRIDIETDSTVFEDEAAVKQQTTELIGAIGTFMKEGLPVVQAAPEMAPLAFELLELAVRRLKQGRSIEDVIENTKESVMQKVEQAKQNPQPSPEAQKAEAEKAKMQMQAQLEQQSAQAEAQRAQEMHALDMQAKQEELAFKREELELKRQEMQMKMQMQGQQMQMDFASKQQDMALEGQQREMEMEASEREHELGAEAMEHKHEMGLEMMAEKARQQKAAAKQKPATK